MSKYTDITVEHVTRDWKRGEDILSDASFAIDVQGQEPMPVAFMVEDEGLSLTYRIGGTVHTVTVPIPAESGSGFDYTPEDAIERMLESAGIDMGPNGRFINANSEPMCTLATEEQANQDMGISVNAILPDVVEDVKELLEGNMIAW